MNIYKAIRVLEINDSNDVSEHEIKKKIQTACIKISS